MPSIREGYRGRRHILGSQRRVDDAHGLFSLTEIGHACRIVPPQPAKDIIELHQRKTDRGKPRRIDNHIDRPLDPADASRSPGSGYALDRWQDLLVDQLGQLERRPALGHHGIGHERSLVCTGLSYDWWFAARGQACTGLVYARAHAVGRIFKAAADRELHDSRRYALCDCGHDHLGTRDGLQGLLDRTGYSGLDILRRSAGMDHRHRNGRKVDIRVALHRQKRCREDTSQRQQRKEQHDNPRIFDRPA